MSRCWDAAISSDQAMSGHCPEQVQNDPTDEIELEEWKKVNYALRQHGMLSVHFELGDGGERSTDLLFMAMDASQSLRDTLNSLMRDCDRRQQLVKELVGSSNQLREELKQQTIATEKYETKSRDLRLMLDSTLSKVDELETLLLESDRNAPNAEATRIQLRYKQLESRNHRQEVEIAHLKDKLNKLQDEEKSRIKVHKKSVGQLKKRIASCGTLSDDRVVDMMNAYEHEIQELQQRLHSDRSGGRSAVQTPVTKEASVEYKAIIKSYEKELQDCKKKAKQVENEKELIQLELHSRPELKDLRSAQCHIKKLERIIKKHNYSDKTVEDSGRRSNDKFSSLTHLETHKHLQRLCAELGVDDVRDALPVVRTLVKYGAAYPKLEQFTNDILKIVNSDGVPVPPDAGRVQSKAAAHEVWCERTWHHVIPTLQFWLEQLQLLNEIDGSLRELHSQFLPWKEVERREDQVTAEDLLQTIQDMMQEDGSSSQQVSSRTQALSRSEQERVVKHFMNLFDVSTVSGIFTRMNDIYTKVGEVHNVMRTLRRLLTLEENAKSSVIVDAVTRLVDSHNQRTSEQLKQLLQVQDIDQILHRLQDYDEFFPAFREIIQDLMDILAVSSIDRVVPSVRLLKLQTLS